MLLQVISVIGALMVLGAYFAYQRGWMGKEQRLYSALNTFGAGMLAYVAIVDGRWGFVLIEGVWTLMSIPALIRPPTPGSAE
jgi:hypothetical protein